MEIPINPGSITMMVILVFGLFLAYGKYLTEREEKEKKEKQHKKSC